MTAEYNLKAIHKSTAHGLCSSAGNAQLRALRAIMDEVYRLFDRRGRTDTALAKLA